MVPERITLLLTAYVDGELSSRKKRAVQRMLRKSPEARNLLLRLQDDARLMRGLPGARLEQDLSDSVVLAINERRLPIARRVPVARRAFVIPAWAGFAAAAAVLLAVFGASYMYFHNVDAPRPTGHNVASNNNTKVTPSPENPANRSTLVAHQPDPVTPPEKSQPGSNPVEPKKSPEAVAEKKTAQPKGTPSPEATKPEDIFTSGSPRPKFEVFKEITTRDTLSLALSDLDKDKSRKQLRDELEKDGAHRMELLVKGSQAIERIESAFKSQGVRLLVDRLAQERLKRQMVTNYVLFVEDITPEEMSRVLETLGSNDKKAETQKKGSGQFGQMFLLPMTDDDHKELLNLLGADPVKFGPRPKGPLGVDIRRPISQTTGQQVSDALTGKGTPRPEPGKAALSRQAIVLSYNPIRAPKTSAEIKKFMEQRQARRPGTLQILLVLRASNG